MKINKDQEAAVLAAIRTEYRRLDQITGVKVAAIPVSLSARLTRKLGYFQIKKTGIFSKPVLSIVIAQGALASKDLFCDVIRHEYAHAALYLMDPKVKHGHDAAWKELCLLIGCRPEATQKGLPYEPRRQKPKYRLICTTCGAASDYCRESKLVKIAEGKLPGLLTCRKCGGTGFKAERIKE